MACNVPPITYFDSDIHTSTAYVVDWLNKKIEKEMAEGERLNASPYPDDGSDLCFARAAAFREVINFLRNG